MTATVELCGCGHAERLHEKDDAAEHGRGVCFKSGCTCSEYRPGGEAAPATPSEPAPASSAEKPAPSHHFEHPCTEPGCDAVFTRPQALGAHRRYKHPKLPAGAKEGTHADRASAPAVTPDAPEVRATESGTPAPVVPDHDEAPEQTGTPAVGPTDGSSSSTGGEAGAAIEAAAPAVPTQRSSLYDAEPTPFYDLGATRIEITMRRVESPRVHGQTIPIAVLDAYTPGMDPVTVELDQPEALALADAIYAGFHLAEETS